VFKDPFFHWKAATSTEEEEGISPDVKSDLRDRCTYQNWKDGKGCTFEIPFPKLKFDIQVHIEPCPHPDTTMAADGIRSALPYFHVQCKGDGCVNVGAPCADCSRNNPNQNCEEKTK
jgi:hypothetical protein